MIGIALANQSGWIAADDTVVRHVVNDYRAGRNDRAFADVDTGHYQDVITNPYFIANDRVVIVWETGKQIAMLPPGAAHDREGKGRRAIHSMVRSIHDEPYPRAKRAKLADDQLLRAIVVEHITCLEGSGVIRVIV